MLHCGSASDSASQPLWAITAYFNPIGYQRRLQNYRTFRAHLNIPLLTVELAFDRDFELDENDANQLVRFRTPDVMWHKERLLNLALEHLPAGCRKVVWLDCDVIYTSDDCGGACRGRGRRGGTWRRGCGRPCS